MVENVNIFADSKVCNVQVVNSDVAGDEKIPNEVAVTFHSAGTEKSPESFQSNGGVDGQSTIVDSGTAGSATSEVSKSNINGKVLVNVSSSDNIFADSGSV